MSLDLRKLEHLIAVTEEAGFTRAAQRLHISQQALSTSIRTLERQVGVELLDRAHQQVTPTAAGQALVDDARALHVQATAALNRARRIGRGEGEQLRVGHTPAVTAEEVLELLARARTEENGIQTQVQQLFPDELRDLLRTGGCDIGLSRAMTSVPGLAHTRIGSHRLRVAVPAGHHLAQRQALSLAELRDERVMVWGEPGRSGYTDLLVSLCREAGFEPHLDRNPVQGTPPVTAVLATEHIAFVTAPPGPAAQGHVQVIDLQPTVLVPVHALWPQHTTSAARDLLLAGVRDAADTGHQPN